MRATTAGSREKSSFLRRRTCACGATWLSPLNTASAKSGAGTRDQKLSNESPELRLMVERVEARDDSTRTVAEQEHRNARTAETSPASPEMADVLDGKPRKNFAT